MLENQDMMNSSDSNQKVCGDLIWSDEFEIKEIEWSPMIMMGHTFWCSTVLSKGVSILFGSAAWVTQFLVELFTSRAAAWS